MLVKLLQFGCGCCLVMFIYLYYKYKLFFSTERADIELQKRTSRCKQIWQKMNDRNDKEMDYITCPTNETQNGAPKKCVVTGMKLKVVSSMYTLYIETIQVAMEWLEDS